MFILLEGIDGAGKGHQRELLIEAISNAGKNVDGLSFPDHDGILYKQLIHPALHQEINLSPKAMVMAFMLDQMQWQDRIKSSLGSEHTHFIIDGYYTTTIVYQSLLLGAISLEEALKLAEMFNLLKPDLAIFIDVDPEIAMKRKNLESGHEEGLDIFEKSLDKQKKIRAGFLKLVKEQIFSEWEIVDGNGSLEKVQADVQRFLSSKNLIKF